MPSVGWSGVKHCHYTLVETNDEACFSVWQRNLGLADESRRTLPAGISSLVEVDNGLGLGLGFRLRLLIPVQGEVNRLYTDLCFYLIG